MDIEKILSELTLEEKAGLCSGADFWRTKAVERLGVPSVMMCDGPHGLRKQKGEGDHLGINESIEAVCFPTESALASSFDRDLLKRLGEALGEECQAEDIAMLLGPGLNIKRSPLCGRNFEYLSEDPYLAGELAAAYVRALQSKGVSACVKHFAANNQETRRMSSSSELDERTLHEIYLPAFEKVVKEGKTRSVMCAYNALNGVFCAENKELLTDILRKRWGFEGFVVTDWGAVKDRVKGLLAGLDLEMPGSAGGQDVRIVEAVRSGGLEEEVLNEAVRNMLRFVADYQEQRNTGAVFNLEGDRAKAADFAKECAVLLKNENKVLPLRKTAKVAFIGEFAEHPRYQGAGSSHINVPHADNVLEHTAGYEVTYVKGFRIKPDEEADGKLLHEAVAAAASADTVVIFAGLPDSFETEGVDRDTMELPENQNALIRAVAAAQPNTVVVLHGGAPVELPWLDEVPAILQMYLAGDKAGEAEAALLFGEANPSGKLAETFPLRLEDNPSFLNFPDSNGKVEYREGIYVGYRYYDKKRMGVLFPFGHGLSYTSFAYRDLELDRSQLRDDETLSVSCKVKNTGACAGKEVVQLYVGALSSSVGRPVRELKGFEKVELQPGEEKTVTFRLEKRAFAYYEPQIHDWFVESGNFRVEIGSSSRDIRLCGEVAVEGTSELPVTYTASSTIGDIMKSKKGRALVDQMMEQMKNHSILEDTQNLGEGSEKMVQAAMVEAPLSAAVSFGILTMEQLDGILAMLNGD